MPVIVFSCVMTVGTTLLFGLLPAFRATKGDVNQALKAAGRSATQEHSKQSLKKWLVAVEVALSVVLLAGAGWLVTSLQRLNNESLGFDPHNLALSSVTLQGPLYATSEARLRFYRRLVENLTHKQDFAYASNLPPYTGGSDVLQIQARLKRSVERLGDTGSTAVSPGYFSMMRTKQLAGRDFNERDLDKAVPVAIVNASLVREYFPHENPLGQQIRIETNQQNAWLMIVGVVEDQKHTQLMHEMSWTANPTIYRPLEQDAPKRMEILTREKDGVKLHVLQEQVAALDADVPVSDWDTMEARLEETTKFARFRAALVSSFALSAVLLAGIGLHGVLAQLVAQRTSEFGIRMAIGAQRRDVFCLVAKQGGVSILLGLGAGLSAAFALQRFLTSLFYEGQSVGLGVMISVTIVLLVVASIAMWLPAWRASRVDPAVALRSE